MHSQENGNRNVRIVKKVDSCRGEVKQSEEVRRQHGGYRHQSHAEKELSRETDDKQHEVHLRRIKLRARNFFAPRDVGGAGGEEKERKGGKWKRRRIEDVCATSFLGPTDQLFRGEAKRHHQELQVKPVRLEPKEQIDAEDDGERTEAESVIIAPRPAEQHVERIRKQ